MIQIKYPANVKTPVPHSKNQHSPEKRGVTNSVGDLFSDIATLAELQFDLLKEDCAESKRKLILPLILLVSGGLCLLGSFPVLLMALAVLLHETFQFSLALSGAAAFLIGLAFSAIVILFSLLGLKKAMASFESSSLELKRNIGWVKGLKQRNRKI